MTAHQNDRGATPPSPSRSGTYLSREEIRKAILELSTAALQRLDKFSLNYSSGKRADADDLIQETLCRVLESRECPTGVKIDTFLYMVMKSINSTRARSTRRHPAAIDEISETARSELPDQLRELEAKQELEEFLRTFNPLARSIAINIMLGNERKEIIRKLEIGPTGTADEAELALLRERSSDWLYQAYEALQRESDAMESATQHLVILSSHLCLAHRKIVVLSDTEVRELAKRCMEQVRSGADVRAGVFDCYEIAGDLEQDNRAAEQVYAVGCAAYPSVGQLWAKRLGSAELIGDGQLLERVCDEMGDKVDRESLQRMMGYVRSRVRSSKDITMRRLHAGYECMMDIYSA